MAALVVPEILVTLEDAINSLRAKGKRKLLKALGYERGDVNKMLSPQVDEELKKYPITNEVMRKADKELRGDSGQYKDTDFLSGDSSTWQNYINSLDLSYDSGTNFADGRNYQEVFSPPEKNSQKPDYGHDPNRSPGITSPAIREGLAVQMDSKMSPSQIGKDFSSIYDPFQNPEEVDNEIAELNFESDDNMQDESDDDMQDGYGSTDEMQGFGPSDLRGQLCPACSSGLCDTHIQLRF